MAVSSSDTAAPDGNNVDAAPARPVDGALGLTAMRALAKFKTGASAESRESKRSVGAQLRAELPPGHLPDKEPVSLAKRLSRAMAKDGMTAGDRKRRAERLAELQADIDAQSEADDRAAREAQDANQGGRRRARGLEGAGRRADCRQTARG